MVTEAEAATTLNGDTSEWPEVAIVVLNWNNYEDTEACLKSLQKNTEYNKYKIYVVDNGSNDGSGYKIATNFSACEVIFNETNRGFAGGMNVGIKRAKEAGADYILVLNNDITVEPGFLRPLVMTAEEYEKVGIVSGVIRFEESGKIQSAGRTFQQTLVKSPHWREVRSSEPYETECISGALALFSQKFIEECGLFDESYFFGMEDVEISWRARNNSWKLMITPHSEVYHKAGKTSEDTPFTWYHRIYGRLHFATNHHSLSQKMLFYTFIFLLISRNTLGWAVDGRTDLIYSVFMAFINHILGRRGKHPMPGSEYSS